MSRKTPQGILHLASKNVHCKTVRNAFAHVKIIAKHYVYKPNLAGCVVYRCNLKQHSQ